MSRKALEGVKVVAASLAESGPVCTQILAILGAEVIHVDRVPDRPERRYAGTVLRNSNKLPITLNTKSEAGKEIMWKLIERADVFFENFSPNAWDRMGFSYEEVKKHNPEIIYVSLKGFASDSRWGKGITFDPVATATGGGFYMNGYENEEPMFCGINVADSGAAIHAALAVLIAVLHKKLTGKGQKIETPMQNAVTVQCRSGFVKYYECGRFWRPGNNYHGTKPTAPHNVYPTSGDDPLGNYIAIACRPEEKYRDFENLCKAIERPDLLADPRYATPESRYENHVALDAEIAKWTIRRDKFEAMKILAKDFGVPAGSVNSMKDIANDEFLSENAMQHVPDPVLGSLHMPTFPATMSGCDIEGVTPGPTGRCNHYVYHDILGYDDEYLEKLKEDRII